MEQARQRTDWTNSANVSWRPRSQSVCSLSDTTTEPLFNHKTSLLGSKSTKKLTIKFLDSKTTEPKIDAYSQSTKYWRVLKESVKRIFRHEPLPDDYHMEFLFKCASKLCRYEKIESIVDNLKQLFEDHIKTLNRGISETDENLHINLNHVWNKFVIDVKFIINIFIVLDRRHLLKTGSGRGLWNISTALFRKYVVSDTINEALVGQILIEIQKDRLGKDVNKTLLKSLVQMLAELGLYDDYFEVSYLKETEKVYEYESRRMVKKLGIHDYLDHISLRISEEDSRTSSYLQESSNKKVLTILIKHFLINNLKKILATGMTHLINNDYDSDSHLRISIDEKSRRLQKQKVKDFERRLEQHKHIRLLYLLTTKYRDGQSTLIKSFYSYIVETGRAILFRNYSLDTPGPPTAATNTGHHHIKKNLMDFYDNKVVETLLNFKTKLDIIVDECFKGHNNFKYKLKDAFETFLKMTSDDDKLVNRQPAEIIAKFIDCKMRSKSYLMKENGKVVTTSCLYKSQIATAETSAEASASQRKTPTASGQTRRDSLTAKSLEELDLEETFNRVMVLFRCVSNKAIFETFYKKDLANRLIKCKTTDLELERIMVGKLRVDCGGKFTSHLEGMFRDVEASKDFTLKFYEEFLKEFEEDGGSGGVLKLGFQSQQDEKDEKGSGAVSAPVAEATATEEKLEPGTPRDLQPVPESTTAMEDVDAEPATSSTSRTQALATHSSAKRRKSSNQEQTEQAQHCSTSQTSTSKDEEMKADDQSDKNENYEDAEADELADVTAIPANENEKIIKLDEIEKNIEFFIITQVHWPKWEHQKLRLPDRVLNGMEAFKAFYLNKHSGRKLDWQHHLGNVILKMNISRKSDFNWRLSSHLNSFELTVSVHHALILLSFASSAKQTFSELLEKTGLEGKDLKRALLSLALGRSRVISRMKTASCLKNSASSSSLMKMEKSGERASKPVPDILEEDIFQFNFNFESDTFKIKISQALGKDNLQADDQKDLGENGENNQNNYGHAIDAAVVRIMKERTTMSHSNLLVELFSSVKFSVNVAEVKKRIESLIEREFISRVEREEMDGETGYKYVA